MRVLVVGERFNMRESAVIRRRMLEASLLPTQDAVARYWSLMLRLGALHGPPAADKLRLAGVPDGHDSVNLMPPAPQGVPWDEGNAFHVARQWWPRLRRYDCVVPCGNNVLRAVSLRLERNRLLVHVPHGSPMHMHEEPGHFDIGSAETPFAVRVPHPSGLCRWWNDPVQVKCLRNAISSSLREGML